MLCWVFLKVYMTEQQWKKTCSCSQVHSYTKEVSVYSTVCVVCAIVNFSIILLFCGSIIIFRYIHVNWHFISPIIYRLAELKYIQMTCLLLMSDKKGQKGTWGDYMLLLLHLMQGRVAGTLNALVSIFQKSWSHTNQAQTDFKKTSKKFPHRVPSVMPWHQVWQKQIKADMLILIKMEKINYYITLFTKMSWMKIICTSSSYYNCT